MNPDPNLTIWRAELGMYKVLLILPQLFVTQIDESWLWKLQVVIKNWFDRKILFSGHSQSQSTIKPVLNQQFSGTQKRQVFE